MAIRFPKIHIAASVQNRILNLADDLPALVREHPAPNVPEPGALGQAIDQAVATPPQAAPAPDDATEAVLAGAVQGESAADAVGGLAAIEAMQ